MKTIGLALTCKAAFEAFENCESRELQKEIDAMRINILDLQQDIIYLKIENGYVSETSRIFNSRFQ